MSTNPPLTNLIRANKNIREIIEIISIVNYAGIGNGSKEKNEKTNDGKIEKKDKTAGTKRKILYASAPSGLSAGLEPPAVVLTLAPTLAIN
jgi:hypothetical protein